MLPVTLFPLPLPGRSSCRGHCSRDAGDARNFFWDCSRLWLLELVVGRVDIKDAPIAGELERDHRNFNDLVFNRIQPCRF